MNFFFLLRVPLLFLMMIEALFNIMCISTSPIQSQSRLDFSDQSLGDSLREGVKKTKLYFLGIISPIRGGGESYTLPLGGGSEYRDMSPKSWAKNIKSFFLWFLLMVMRVEKLFPWSRWKIYFNYIFFFFNKDLFAFFILMK